MFISISDIINKHEKVDVCILLTIHRLILLALPCMCVTFLQGYWYCILVKRTLIYSMWFCEYHTVLEITVGHWPFSDQFEHLANQNLF